MNFVTLFPETRNIELIKDVGMIPYNMHKYHNYNSIIACYNNGEYSNLNKEIKGVRLNFIKKYSRKSVINGAIYIIKNYKDIDVLNIFHFNKRSCIWILLYKLLNKKGKVYLKLDANIGIKSKKNNKRSIKGLLEKIIINKCNLISVESKELYKYIKSNWIEKVEYIPNGFLSNNKRKIANKKNYIITVGRIGAKEKANDILLEAFKNVSDKIPKWKLKFIGPIDKKFERYIEEYFSKNPYLKDRIEFVGAIYDRKKLDQEYEKAKVFCLTSLYESFGLVLVEAIKSGCYILSSDVPAAKDITFDGKYGSIFPIGDVEKLSEYILETCLNEDKLTTLSHEIQDFAYENFEWRNICDKIQYLLDKK